MDAPGKSSETTKETPKRPRKQREAMEAKQPGVWATKEGKKQFLASFFG
jgi:hypothetical protein